MKRIALIPILFILSCSPSSSNVADVAERDGETYFTINGNKAEFMGTFDQKINPIMWKVNKQEIVTVEQIIQKAAISKTTNQMTLDSKKLMNVSLTDNEVKLLK